jgi:hypothetical protein
VLIAHDPAIAFNSCRIIDVLRVFDFHKDVELHLQSRQLTPDEHELLLRQSG